MASKTREQPTWTAPQRGDVALPPLKIYNSLTRRLDDFVPADPEGKIVKWYTCGPTVYDDAHLGHARSFVSIDIIRRIMQDYFHFRVVFCENITDIDDKIILRARQQHLLCEFKKRYEETGPVPVDVLETAKSAFALYVNKNLPLLHASQPLETSPYKRVLDGQALAEGALPGDKEAKLRVHLRAAEKAAEALQQPSTVADFFANTDDILLPYLDSLHGASIDSDDHSIFLALTQLYEKKFYQDMQALNVMDPSIKTRVTEFVPQIVAFIEKIVANGFGYVTSDGSVYFDVEAFEQAGHPYARLEPWSRNDKALQADGEGSLSSSGLKKNDHHFALWKASKPGEPAWQSPWGQGRPGWHIECSVMASMELGEVLDIHSGGVDLRFPHHDNELAQSEAYWCQKGDLGSHSVEWVKYFLHTGHLSIAGSKMSKSLKNFVTIRQALERKDWTYRSLRICFLLGNWTDGVEVTDELLKTVSAWESKLDNFFLKASDIARHPDSRAAGASRSADTQLLESLERAKLHLHQGLCDSFNTPVAMRVLSDLVTEANNAKHDVSNATLLTIARWITRTVTMFGLDKHGCLQDDHLVAWSGVDIPTVAQLFVYPASRLRDQIRLATKRGPLDHDELAGIVDEVEIPSVDEADQTSAAKYQAVLGEFKNDVLKLVQDKAPTKDFLCLCDELRDTKLWELGIYLEDRDPPLHALVRPLDDSIKEAREKAAAAAAQKHVLRRKKEAEEIEKNKALKDKSKLSPLDMFRTDEYSAWDENGVPTMEKSGDEVTKSKKKKLAKEWEKQKKLHEAWVAGQARK